jgi:16S rRNA G966 N2-methylase RsmD
MLCGVYGDPPYDEKKEKQKRNSNARNKAQVLNKRIKTFLHDLKSDRMISAGQKEEIRKILFHQLID